MPDHDRIAGYFGGLLEALLDQPNPTKQLQAALTEYFATIERGRINIKLVVEAALDQRNPTTGVRNALKQYLTAVDHRCTLDVHCRREEKAANNKGEQVA